MTLLTLESCFMNTQLFEKVQKAFYSVLIKSSEKKQLIIKKIIESTQNWFGHLISDVAGSKTSKGRGSGLPVPGWAALQKLQFGSFEINGSP